MITPLENLPANMVGFRATDTITEKDFTDTVMPAVKEVIDQTGHLNYLLVLDTSIKNFTMGAWMQDGLMGIKHLTKWKRAAIVSDLDAIRTFTDAFSIVIPGEFKGFKHSELDKAIAWVSEGK
ncbi:STAS/SEC14 domain-containing protein [Sphingobacteriaceae bacterium]|nr:STAS/SEC14 domain-containing protein [Sphingobacteriaceae bacterium]